MIASYLHEQVCGLGVPPCGVHQVGLTQLLANVFRQLKSVSGAGLGMNLPRIKGRGGMWPRASGWKELRHCSLKRMAASPPSPHLPRPRSGLCPPLLPPAPCLAAGRRKAQLSGQRVHHDVVDVSAKHTADGPLPSA